MIRVLIAVAAAALPALSWQQERGQLDYSSAMFTVMAAVNAAGYDTGLESPANHPLRKAVREEIARRNPPSLPEIRAFLRQHRQEDAAWELRQYMSFAVLIEDAPKFDFRLRNNQLPPDVAALEGLIPLLRKFYQEAGIEDLHKRSIPYYDQFLAKYQMPTIKAVQEVSAYLRAPTSGGFLGRRFQIYVDLLGPPNQILRMSFLGDYFLIATHSAEPHIDDVRETYLHFLLEPLATKHGEKIEEKRGISDYVQAAPFLADHYKQDFLLLTTTSLIRAIQARLAPAAGRQRMVDEAMGQAFVLTAHFHDQLPAYEKQETSMQQYFPDLIQSIDLRKEGRRLDALEFSKTRPVRKAKPVAAPPPPAPKPWEKQLEAAEDVYAARKFDDARKAFAAVLPMTDDKSVHARAYFGLARIAALNKDPELSEKLFQKTLELGPPAQEKAWTLVYLGRLSWAAGDKEIAAARYKEALAVQGASPKARDAAGKALRETQDPK